MAHWQFPQHREGVEGGAKGGRGEEEIGGIEEADSGRQRSGGIPEVARAGWLGTVSVLKACYLLEKFLRKTTHATDVIHCRITQRVDFLYESGLATGKGDADDLMSKKITLSGPKQPDLSQVSGNPIQLYSV